MSRQGYIATVDNPNCIYYKELMEQYPNAKVRLSIRHDDGFDDGNDTGGLSYAKSVLNSIANFGPLIHGYAANKWWSLKTVIKMREIHDWHWAGHNCPCSSSYDKKPSYNDLKTSYSN